MSPLTGEVCFKAFAPLIYYISVSDFYAFGYVDTVVILIHFGENIRILDVEMNIGGG